MLSSLRVSVKTSFVFLVIFTAVIFGTGYYLYGRDSIKTDNRSVYEFKSDLLKERLQLNPGDNQLELELAMAQYLEGKSDDSLKTYQEILENDPQNITALFYAGLINNDLKKYEEASVFLEKVVFVKPSFQPRLLYVNLGIAYFYSGNYSKAIYNLNKAANIDPGSATVHYYLGMSYQQTRQYQNARIALEKAVQIGGNNEEARKALESVNNYIKRGKQQH